MASGWTQAVIARRRAQERGNGLPLLGYFGVVGSALVVLLLIVDFMLAPDKPDRVKQAPAGIEATVAKPRLTTGAAPAASPVVPAAPATQAQPAPDVATNGGQAARGEQSSGEITESSTIPTQTRGKAQRSRTKGGNPPVVPWGNPAGSAYSGYAQERPVWHSPAEGTLGPH